MGRLTGAHGEEWGMTPYFWFAKREEIMPRFVFIDGMTQVKADALS
jgi:hypothetical protein